MEDVLDTTFYNDDFLTRTLTSSVLYDKSQLDLTFTDNNNCPPSKHNHNATNIDSPNLDFLKLESPDLERIFMNINEDESELSPSSSNSKDDAAFNLADDLVNSDNCFTDALQQLHDKQDLIPDFVDVACNKVGKENLHSKILDTRKKPPALIAQPQTNSQPPPLLQQKFRTQNPMKQLYHNPAQSRRSNFQSQNKPMSRLNLPIQQQQNISHISLNEQMTLNNQLAIINNMNQSLTAHQLQQHHQQQQQEIAFLTQAMSMQTDRENNLAFQHERETSHVVNPNGFSSHNSITHQVPSHLQQKIMEQQLIQQQQQLSFQNNDDNSLQQHMQQVDSLNAMGVDETTLKMLMENPHMVPVNLELQELIKRERKKLRNRVASSKCRKRKLEREGRLEDRVKDLKEKNIELNAVANALKQQICDLKQRVMDHVGEGCQIVLPS